MPAVRAPRIYNLFPLLAGQMERWSGHLPRIAGMGFDWIFLNPFHYPGFSGSLYAIKDFDRLHPVVAGDSDKAWEPRLKRFCKQAESHGLKVMIDLVINHTAKDAVLADEHPGWYKREPDGALKSPRAVDPGDPRNVTVWGDLAEIDYDGLEHRGDQIAYWTALLRRYLKAGVKGFRCDAAYQVPPGVWQPLISATKKIQKEALFAAETLGCTEEEAAALAPAGFDLMFNSAKWWDFRARWLLDQYERYRHIAPTVAFPESHDTPRLIAELGLQSPAQAEPHYRFHYGWAASFSAGVMMPMGYEYGFSEKLDVKSTRPGQWDAEMARRPFDITEFIGAVNALKAWYPAYGEEGRQERISAPHAGYVALARSDADGHHAVTLLNPHPNDPVDVPAGRIANALGTSAFEERTPGAVIAPLEPGSTVHLPPLGVRMYVQKEAKAETAKAPPEKAQRDRLFKLAETRLAIEGVTPQIDGGRFPVKRIVGGTVEVEADVFPDGHDKIRAAIRYRQKGARRWEETPLAFIGNDRWSGTLPLSAVGRVEYEIVAWRDQFESWREGTAKKVAADQAVTLELIEGIELVKEAAEQAKGADKKDLEKRVEELEALPNDGDRLSALMHDYLHVLMQRAGPRTNLSVYETTLEVVVDRPAAEFAAWYEMFPRSQSGDPNRHGTFKDVIPKLAYVRDLGFDTLYFTPIHPIGRKNRKGRNNSLTAGPDDPGSVYAVGSKEGGHKDVHPKLGTLEDFRELVAAAREHGLEIALDIAIQCAPDHPWLEEHPEWFDWRPDGTIKYAENPPKKYEDIVNVHFYRDAIPDLWFELKSVFEFWIAQGATVFRVDNPHTKPYPFWEWCISEIKARHPEAIFLAEAFSRPKVMKRLAKLGFTQSYTYFTWRNAKAEMAEYLTELTTTEAKEYFRPNFFPNTPDINPAVLQTSARPAYIMRYVLAATLSGVYGMYNGFEICEGTPLPGKEEYLDSEKYEIKVWDFDRPGHIKDIIRKVNAIRRDNPALRSHKNLTFLNAWNDNILYYLKATPERDNAVLVMVNMDYHHPQECHFEVPLWEFGLPDAASVRVEDLLEGYEFDWTGKVQHIRLDPAHMPVKIWRLTPPAAT